MTEASPPTRRLFDWRILPLVLVTAAVMWVLVHHLAGVDAFSNAVAGARWSLVFWATAVFGVNLVLAILRWQLILRAMSYPIGFLRCAHAVIAVWPLAVVIPARAGDVFRAGAIRDKVPFFEGAGSVVAEKAFDVQSLCILSIVGTLAHGFYLWTAVAAGVLVAEWLVLYVLIRHREAALRTRLLKRFAGKANQLLAALEALFRSPIHLVGVLAASLGAWTMSSFVVHLLLGATGANVGYGVTLSLWPIAVFAGMLPVTVAGMGTRDALFVLAVRATSDHPIAEESVLAATLGFSLIATWLLVIIGIPFAIRLALRLTRPDPSNEHA